MGYQHTLSTVTDLPFHVTCVVDVWRERVKERALLLCEASRLAPNKDRPRPNKYLPTNVH